MPGKSLIYDSGAFSVHNAGKPDIDIYEFCDWCLEEKRRWRGRIDSLGIMTLDVIGDQEKTNKHTEFLTLKGVDPIAIITNNATDNQMEKILEEYDYVAIGGLTGVKNRKKKIDLIDRVFRKWYKHFQNGRKIKIHLLGVGTEETFVKYPAYSADMSSWYLALAGFGRGHFMNKKIYGDLDKIPKYGGDDLAKNILNYMTIQYIKYFKNMSEYVTKLWETRGVKWDE
jgi:hypothetical protein